MFSSNNSNPSIFFHVNLHFGTQFVKSLYHVFKFAIVFKHCTFLIYLIP